MNNASIQQKSKSRDTRVPVSVTRIGKFTVRVFDEAQAQAEIARYYGADEPAPARKRKPYIYLKKKPSARFDWTPKGDYMRKGA